MIFIKNKIKGVFLIKPEPFKDKRGIFRRIFCQKEFKKNNLVNIIRQANISENKFRYTLRGFHYQTNPFGEDKTLTCVKGSIYDIVVDLRPKSKTYMKWCSFQIDEKNKNLIHIPRGCANAFLTLKNNTLVQYNSSEFYKPKYEKGIRYNDPLFKFKWPQKPKIISNKDLSHPNYIMIK